jgi:hypothetical protein
MFVQLLQQLLKFVRSYKLMHWLCIFLFCGFSTYANYFLGLKKWMYTLTDLEEYLAYFGLFAFHQLAGFLLYSFFCKDFSFWRKSGFWALLLSGILIFAFRVSYDGHYEWIASLSPIDKAWIYQSIFRYAFQMAYIFLPILIIWIIMDKGNQPLYGFSTKLHQTKLYWGLLILMVPLIIFASTQPDFLNFYPRASKLNQANVSVPLQLVFEFFYGIDFIAIELFFRGFLVIAFMRYVGIHAVLPMACFYLSIHFGKPIGETISSFFGGSILGVIAYHSKSIYGGVMAHVGIAWMMELGGFIGNYFRQH